MGCNCGCGGSGSGNRETAITLELPAVESPGGGRIRDKRAPASADVVTVAGVGGRKIPLHRVAAAAWQQLVAAARAGGIKAPLLLPTSGFRDPARQRRLWEQALRRYGSPEEARKWVAPPGGSAHQSGRAIDFYLGGRNSSGNVARLRTLPAYRWLLANARRFGFYPYEREPWHWEYNPPGAGSQELAEELGVAHELDELLGERGRGGGRGRSAGRRPAHRGRWRRRPQWRRRRVWYLPPEEPVWAEPAPDGTAPEPAAAEPVDDQEPGAGDGELLPWFGLDGVGKAIGGAIAPRWGAPAAVSAPPPAVRQGTLARLRAVLPSIERHRGDIPLDLILGWVAVESAGRIDRPPTKLDERGLFQLHPKESARLKLDHRRLSADADYSVQGGVRLIRHYAGLAARWGFAPGTDMFWRMVKFLHSMGTGAVKTMLDDMRAQGATPGSWAAVKQYAARHHDRLRDLFGRKYKHRFDPVKWVGNVDRVFQRGRELAAQLRRG